MIKFKKKRESFVMVFVLLDCFNRFIKRCVIFFPNEIFFNIIILLRLFSIEK